MEDLINGKISLVGEYTLTKLELKNLKIGSINLSCFKLTLLYLSGASGLHLTKHENFHGGLDAISVGDGLFTILTTLSKRATSVQVMLQPILTYMACGYMGRQVSIRLCCMGFAIKLSLHQIWYTAKTLTLVFILRLIRGLFQPVNCRSPFSGSSCECWTQAKLSRSSMTWVGILCIYTILNLFLYLF